MAQKCKGRTIAVVGCGLNYIYPEENRTLFNSILENGGCIVSEYPSDTPVDVKNFPTRNRIISGLANGVLVIEAAYRSGSTITGRLALEQGKKAFCLPRNLGESKGVGTNELIQKGAKLVTCAQDILEEYGDKYAQKENIQKTEACSKEKEQVQKKNRSEAKMKENPREEEDETKNINIPKEYIQIYQLISYTPQNIQYFASQSGLRIAEVTQKLIMLELQGYIKSLPRKLLY